MITLKSLLFEGKDARDLFRVPSDYKTNYSKYNGVTFGKDFAIGFGYVPVSKLKAAGVPSEVGDHVRRMEKVLKSGKKLPPIAVMITKDGRFDVRDGNTRTLALKRLGFGGKVPAVVAAWKPSQLKTLETF